MPPPSPKLLLHISGEEKSPIDADIDTERPRPAKRARVALACTRCKTRKQKCDGVQPSCSNCKNTSTPCEYIISKSMPYGKYQYMKALETRVAELETLLGNAGLTDSGKDHWDTIWQGETSSEIAPPAHAGEQTASLPLPNSGSKRQSHRDDPGSTLQHLKDLSLEADGGYVGDESSNITVGHMLRSIVQGKQSPAPPVDSVAPLPSPNSVSQQGLQQHLEITSKGNYPCEISDEIAETLVKAYCKHISTRWVALYRPLVQSLHKRREKLVDPFEISSLNLIYAIGGRFLETTGQTGNYFSDQHYATALVHLDAVLQLRDIKSVQTLLLHAIYCLRAPRGLSAWTHVGVAIRIAIELGLHRKMSTDAPSVALEIRKRLFWSCYCLDRQVSIILGRPFAISDHDIDVELPLDVDGSIGEDEFQRYIKTFDAPSMQATSLSCFIHMIRLRRIESKIQQTIYRVDKEIPIPHTVVNHFILELASWKESIPPEPLQDMEVYSFDGYIYYMLYYFKALRFVLYPHVTGAQVDTNILIKCADACGGVCRTYKTLHRQTSVGFSLMALYSVFLSGLTLVYCIWVSPKQVYTIATSDDLNSCSIVLYVITERWPAAKKYRDAFESIKQGVLELITSSDQPRKPLAVQDADLRATLEDVQKLHPEGRADFSRMMTDMIGETNQVNELSVQQGVQGQFGGFSNVQPESDGTMFRFGQDPGGANLSMGFMENGLTGDVSDMGMGQLPLGAVDFLDGFDMQDFMPNGYQFGDPML